MATPGRSWRFETVLRGLRADGPWDKDAIDTMFGDVGHLAELTGDERTDAEDLAIATLRAGDPRAAIALADAGCVRAVPALVDLATSASATVSNRLWAARGLVKLGHATGRAVAVEVLRDTTNDRIERREAIRVLAAWLDDDLYYQREPAGVRAVRLDRETVAVLEEATADPDREVRSWAAWVVQVLPPGRPAGRQEEINRRGEVEELLEDENQPRGRTRPVS